MQINLFSIPSQSPAFASNLFQKNKMILTFCIEPLGDLIESPWYGYFGLDFYVSTQYPNINWKVQNLAVGVFTTRSFYEH